MLLFSKPYLENRLILVGRKGADVSAGTLGALTGKRIAIVEGYAYGDDVERAGPTFVRSRSEEDSVTQLLSGGVDYVLMDDLVVQYIVDHHAKEAQTRLQLGSTPLLTRQLYFAVRRGHPDAQSIIDRFNAQLRGMIADHTYHRLLHVDWIQADVDDDGLLEYVPRSDQAGTTEPQRAYSIFSAPQLSTPQARGDTSRRTALLRRRQHLSRLGDGAGHLQADGTADGESRSLHRHDLPFRLVASAGPGRARGNRRSSPGVCHRDGPAGGR